MRKMLLSSASVAALLTLAACGDDVAEVETEEPAAVEQAAEPSATPPPSDDAVDTAESTEPATEPTDMAATAEADAGAEVQEIGQAITNAKAALETESYEQAMEALEEVETAIPPAADADEIRQAVTDAKTAIEAEAYDQAMQAVEEAEAALEQMAGQPISGETTGATTGN